MTAPPSQPHGCRTTAMRWRSPGVTPTSPSSTPPLMLAGIARQWIDDLPEKSICNWLDMQEAFTKNFEGMYKRPCTVGDLQWCVQEKDETSCAYLSCWLDMKNSCTGVHA